MSMSRNEQRALCAIFGLVLLVRSGLSFAMTNGRDSVVGWVCCALGLLYIGCALLGEQLLLNWLMPPQSGE